MFGWQINKIPDMDYHWATTTESDPKTAMPKNPGAINGGMLPRKHPEHRTSMVVLVESIDEHLKKVEASGGRATVPKMAVGTHGFFAQISDTEGNDVGI